jgi:hypothetical protein
MALRPPLFSSVFWGQILTIDNLTSIVMMVFTKCLSLGSVFCLGEYCQN